MALILEKKSLPYDSGLTLETMEKHANGYLRYQNFSDLVTQGPAAVQAFIDRANLLFKRMIQQIFPAEAGQVSPLNLSYLTVFFRYESEAQEEALPMADFLKFSFKDNGRVKSGFGIFFSFFGRELERARLESGRDTIKLGASAVVYQLMFNAAFPDVGVLEGYPIMTMRQPKNGKTNDLLHQFYSQLGAKLKVVQPHDCPAKLRCYYHGSWTAIDPKVRIGAVSLGQAMQECIRIDEYRYLEDPETEHLPVFDWNHHSLVAREQSRLAQQWFSDHSEGIEALKTKYGLIQQGVSPVSC